MDFPKSVPGVGLVNGVFVDEDALAAKPGSLIPSVWGNSVTLEILNVLAAAGVAPDELKVNQLAEAISKIATGAAVAWNRVTGKPTTAAGYGIKDVYTRAESDNFLAFKVTGDSCPTAGFYAGSKTRPYMLHADATVVELATLIQLVATNAAVAQRVTGDSCPTAGFYAGSKTRPYMLHADATVVELPTLIQLVATNAAVAQRITAVNCAQAGFVDGTANTPFMTHNNGTTVGLARADSVVGVGQSWQDVTGVRAASTIYTNTTPKPIMVSVYSGNDLRNELRLTVGGVEVSKFALASSAGAQSIASVTAIVPPGATYIVSVGSGAISKWTELR